MPKKTRTLKPVLCEPLRAYHRAARGIRDGRRYWQVVWHEGGDTHSVPGASGWYTRAEVARAMSERVAAGTYGQARPDGTLAGLLDAWCGHCAEVVTNHRTLRNQLNSTERLLPVVGHIRVDRLSMEGLARARKQLSSKYADSTVDLTFRNLSAAWNWGREMGHVEDRKLPLPKAPRGGQKHRRVYNHYTPTSREVEATIAHLPDDWRTLVVEVLYATGARVGEVTRIGWDSFDIGERPALMVGADTKTGARRVPLNPAVVAILQRARERFPDGKYWHGHAKPNHHTLHQAITRACKAAGVPAWTPHGLRRLAFTNMCLANVPIHVAARITGHSEKVALKLYAQVRAENAVDAVAVIGRGVGDAGEGAQVIPIRRRKG